MSQQHYQPLRFSGKTVRTYENNDRFWISPNITVSNATCHGFIVSKFDRFKRPEFEKCGELDNPGHDPWLLVTWTALLNNDRLHYLAVREVDELEYYPLTASRQDTPNTFGIYPQDEFEQQIGYLTALDGIVIRETVATYFRLLW